MCERERETYDDRKTESNRAAAGHQASCLQIVTTDVPQTGSAGYSQIPQ